MKESHIFGEEEHTTLEGPDLEYPGNLGRTVAERVSPGRRLATEVAYNLGAEDEERVVVTVKRRRPTGGDDPQMRLGFDPESAALYIRIGEGDVEETLDLAEPGFGAHVDVDHEGNVLGLEFLSFKEYAELLTRFDGTLKVPERVENSASFSTPVPPNP